MPSNKQIDETLRYVEDTPPVDIDQLSPDGRKLIQDARDIIETARVMVRKKNADELFQNFAWHTRDMDISQRGMIRTRCCLLIRARREMTVRLVRTWVLFL
jgi:hypothetical protein